MKNILFLLLAIPFFSQAQLPTEIKRPVYPGNTTGGFGILGNDTGIADPVNMEDLLMLGLNYGKSGTARTDQQTTFTPLDAPYWFPAGSNDGFATGSYSIINLKHVDTNGDGIINIADTSAISQNFGQSFDWDCSEEEITSAFVDNCDIDDSCPSILVKYDYRGHSIYKIALHETPCHDGLYLPIDAYLDCQGQTIAYDLSINEIPKIPLQALAQLTDENELLICGSGRRCLFDDITSALATLGYSPCAAVEEHPFRYNGELVYAVRHQIESDGPYEFYTCTGEYICGNSESSNLICTDQIPQLGAPLQILQEENSEGCDCILKDPNTIDQFLTDNGLPLCTEVTQYDYNGEDIFYVKSFYFSEGNPFVQSQYYYDCSGQFICGTDNFSEFTQCPFALEPSEHAEFSNPIIIREKPPSDCTECVFTNPITLNQHLADNGFSSCARVLQYDYNNNFVFWVHEASMTNGVPSSYFDCSGQLICNHNDLINPIPCNFDGEGLSFLTVIQETNLEGCADDCYFEENYTTILANYPEFDGDPSTSGYRISKYLYNEQEVFYLEECSGFWNDDFQYVFNCDGSELCRFGGLAGETGADCPDFFETATLIDIIVEENCYCLFANPQAIVESLPDYGFSSCAGITQYEYNGRFYYMVQEDVPVDGSAFYYDCQGTFLCGITGFSPPTPCTFDVQDLTNPIVIQAENAAGCQSPLPQGKTASVPVQDIHLRAEVSNIMPLPDGQQLYDFAVYLEGAAGEDLDRMYGLAFSIDYTSPLPAVANVVFEDTDGSSLSWLGDVNSSNDDDKIIAMSKNIPSADGNGGKLAVGITRINQQGVNGNGQLCRVICVATIDDWDLSALGKTQVLGELNINLEKVCLTTPTGDVLEVNTNSITVPLESIGIEKVAKVKAMLQGPFDESTGLMNNILQQQGLIPNAQPYNKAPWNYNGGETLENFPLADQVVDWVLVELRDAENESIIRGIRAGLLLTDGRIVSPSNVAGVPFNGLFENESYKVIVRHRSHLAVYSSQLMQESNGELSYDFTTAVTKAAGAAQQYTANETVATLHVGDINGDGLVTVLDFNNYLQDSAAINLYSNADCNMDRAVTIKDFNLYLRNSSIIGVNIIRY